MSDGLDALRRSVTSEPDPSLSLGSQLPLQRCPHCGIANPHIKKMWGPNTTTAYDKSNPRDWSTFTCSTCGGMILAASTGGNTGQVTEMYPTARGPHPALPDKAQHYLGEAIETLNSPSASIMVAASAVDEMLKAKDYTDGTLYNRIDRAKEDGLITEDMADWAHDVRLDANDQRHADEDADPPDMKDARRCVDFAEAFGEFLFVLPARVKRGREDAKEDEEDGEE